MNTCLIQTSSETVHILFSAQIICGGDAYRKECCHLHTAGRGTRRAAGHHQYNRHQHPGFRNRTVFEGIESCSTRRDCRKQGIPDPIRHPEITEFHQPEIQKCQDKQNCRCIKDDLCLKPQPLPAEPVIQKIPPGKKADASEYDQRHDDAKHPVIVLHGTE